MKYTTPEMEIVRFSNEAIVVASATTVTTEDVIGSDELD